MRCYLGTWANGNGSVMYDVTDQENQREGETVIHYVTLGDVSPRGQDSRLGNNETDVTQLVTMSRDL